MKFYGLKQKNLHKILSTKIEFPIKTSSKLMKLHTTCPSAPTAPRRRSSSAWLRLSPFYGRRSRAARSRRRRRRAPVLPPKLSCLAPAGTCRLSSFFWLCLLSRRRSRAAPDSGAGRSGLFLVSFAWCRHPCFGGASWPLLLTRVVACTAVTAVLALCAVCARRRSVVAARLGAQ